MQTVYGETAKALDFCYRLFPASLTYSLFEQETRPYPGCRSSKYQKQKTSGQVSPEAWRGKTEESGLIPGLAATSSTILELIIVAGLGDC